MKLRHARHSTDAELSLKKSMMKTSSNSAERRRRSDGPQTDA